MRHLRWQARAVVIQHKAQRPVQFEITLAMPMPCRR